MTETNAQTGVYGPFLSDFWPFLFLLVSSNVCQRSKICLVTAGKLYRVHRSSFNSKRKYICHLIFIVAVRTTAPLCWYGVVSVDHVWECRKKSWRPVFLWLSVKVSNLFPTRCTASTDIWIALENHPHLTINNGFLHIFNVPLRSLYESLAFGKWKPRAVSWFHDTVCFEI